MRDLVEIAAGTLFGFALAFWTLRRRIRETAVRLDRSAKEWDRIEKKVERTLARSRWLERNVIRSKLKFARSRRSDARLREESP